MVPLMRRGTAPRLLNLATQVGSFAVITNPESPLKDGYSARNSLPMASP